MSVFILAGTELKATIQFDGPLPEDEGPIQSGSSLQSAIRKLEQGHHAHDALTISETVDFEHLNIGGGDEEDEGEEEYTGFEEEETMEQRKERRSLQRKKALEARQRRDQRKTKQRLKVQNEGEPYQRTVVAPISGWYRYCVQGTWYQVVAEMELRKASEMGGLSEDTGHVNSMYEKSIYDEENFMAEDTAASEGIKEDDFLSTREKLQTLRRLLADIQSKQSQERHRLIVHAATNEHSHSHMVLGSLLETILFMVVTSFQVYTIRKWFRGAPVLGR